MKIIFFLISISITINCYSNEFVEGYYHNTLYPQSPNAASLGQYGGVPIGHFYGTPNISIPIYEINLDGLTIPISLSYNASGIKVSQESSWVGLGWSLNAGGCITHEVRGKDDFPNKDNYYNYIPYYEWKDNVNSSVSAKIGLNGRFIFEKYKKDLNYLSVESFPLFFEYLKVQDGDFEPDLFYFNFIDNSGTMFFDRKNKGRNTEYTAYPYIRRINTYLDIKYNIYPQSWEIKDGNGFSYYFSSKDITTTYNKSFFPNGSLYPFTLRDTEGIIRNYNTHSPDGDFASDYDVCTAWYLDSIVSPNHRKVVFEYEEENTKTLYRRSDYAFEVFTMLVPTDRETDIPIKSTSVQYSKIKQMRLVSIKTDLLDIEFHTGVYRQDVPGAKCLGRILIRNKDYQTLKMIDLEYSFKGKNKNSTSLRMFLDEVKDVTDIANIKRHILTYDKTELPEKFSPEKDHWGYYNGNKHNGGAWGTSIPTNVSDILIPSLTVKVDDNNFIKYLGANRDVDTTKIRAGILTSIKYPTGGDTYFNYEPNMRSLSYGVPSKTIFGGGLRIKSIYDISDNVKYNYRNYKYCDEYGTSTMRSAGSLLSAYFYSIEIEDKIIKATYNPTDEIPYSIEGIDFICEPIQLAENNSTIFFPLSRRNGRFQYLVAVDNCYSQSGNPFYRQVEEIFGQYGDEGKVVYKFLIGDEKYSLGTDAYLELPFKNPWLRSAVPSQCNGLPLATETYEWRDGKYFMIKKVVNEYSVSTQTPNVYGLRVNVHPYGGYNQFLVPYYYDETTEWWKIDKTETTDYFPSGNIQTNVSYTYDTNYYLPKTVTTQNSNGSTIKICYLYPFDINSEVYSKMVYRGQINNKIEAKEYCDNYVVNGTLTTYREFKGLYLPYMIHSLNKNVGAFSDFNGVSVGYHYQRPAEAEVIEYDKKGNIVEYINKDKLHITYLWGYNYSYPIAEIKNATYAQVKSVINEATINALAQSYNPQITQFKYLRTDSRLKDALVTTFSYVPMVGVSTIIDPSGRKVEYRYDVAGRLLSIVGDDGNVIEDFEYNYKK